MHGNRWPDMNYYLLEPATGHLIDANYPSMRTTTTRYPGAATRYTGPTQATTDGQRIANDPDRPFHTIAVAGEDLIFFGYPKADL